MNGGHRVFRFYALHDTAIGKEFAMNGGHLIFPVLSMT